MSISRRLRFEILRRDNYSCRYCGGKAPDVSLTVDHVIPAALGGRDEPQNLVAACQPCNAGKSSIPADASVILDVADDAIRWRRAMETATSLCRFDDEALLAAGDKFHELWCDWRSHGGQGDVLPLPNNWRQSVEHFITLGLTTTELARYVEAAMVKPKLPPSATFSYFAACSWNEVTRRQELARQLLVQEEA